MAVLTFGYSETGLSTLYAMFFSANGDTVWNTVGAALEAYNAANIADYDVALAERGASLIYKATIPALTAGIYDVVVKLRAGGSPVESDVVVGGGTIDWNGTTISLVSASSGTTQMTESYAADGVAPTRDQIQFMIWSYLAERNLSGNTITCARLDGSTTAMTFTIDSQTITRTQTRTT